MAIGNIKFMQNHSILPSSAFSDAKETRLGDQEMRAHRSGDRVSISEEARQMAHGDNAAALSEKQDAESSKMKFTSGDASPVNRAKGRDIWQLLMESLFMAELEDSGCPSAGSAKEGIVSEEPAELVASVNPLRDGVRTAELKQVIAGIMTGKAGLEDLPEALATGKSGNYSDRRKGAENDHAAGRHVSSSEKDSVASQRV